MSLHCLQRRQALLMGAEGSPSLWLGHCQWYLALGGYLAFGKLPRRSLKMKTLSLFHRLALCRNSLRGRTVPAGCRPAGQGACWQLATKERLFHQNTCLILHSLIFQSATNPSCRYIDRGSPYYDAYRVSDGVAQH